jgi:hypothetical protein
MQNSESQLQADCFKWAWNNRPETRRLLAYNLNNSVNARQGNMNKALGIIAGRADMELLWRGRIYYFEFKFGYGKQSKDQKRFQEVVESHGAKYYIIDSFELFQKTIITITQT